MYIILSYTCPPTVHIDQDSVDINISQVKWCNMMYKVLLSSHDQFRPCFFWHNVGPNLQVNIKLIQIVCSNQLNFQQCGPQCVCQKTNATFTHGFAASCRCFFVPAKPVGDTSDSPTSFVMTWLQF